MHFPPPFDSTYHMPIPGPSFDFREAIARVRWANMWLQAAQRQHDQAQDELWRAVAGDNQDLRDQVEKLEHRVAQWEGTEDPTEYYPGCREERGETETWGM